MDTDQTVSDAVSQIFVLQCLRRYDNCSSTARLLTTVIACIVILPNDDALTETWIQHLIDCKAQQQKNST